MNPIEIFFSYAHEDEELMNDVRRQLVVLERNDRILKWHDRKIPAGEEWREMVSVHIVLVSSGDRFEVQLPMDALVRNLIPDILHALKVPNRLEGGRSIGFPAL